MDILFDRRVLLLIIFVILIIVVLQGFPNKSIEHLQITHNKHEFEKAELKQVIYKDILERTKRALDRLDIRFFLSSGTCLGYFREGKIIAHDYDVDVGIWSTDYNPEIIKEMDKEGLKLYRIWGNIKKGMELSFILPNTKLGRHAKIDIFLHYRNTDNKGKTTVSWFTYSPKKRRIQYRVSDFSIQQTKFLDVDVYVPYPTLQYIQEHYGDNWMVPIKPKRGYSYYSSPKSIVK